jgi:hypothetical protein
MSAARWLIEGLIPAGAVVGIADLGDGSPEDILALGFDVVIYLHGRGEMDDGPVLLDVRWRPGLVQGAQAAGALLGQADTRTWVRARRRADAVDSSGRGVTVEELLTRLEKVRKNERGWSARCPAHLDQSPSLSIAEGDDGRILLRCFAGCPTDRVCAAIGLRLSDLFANDRGERYAKPWTPSTSEERRLVENGRLRRQVRALKLERRRAEHALHLAALVIATAYDDDPASILERLWRDATEQLEAEAAAQAETAA